MIKHTIEISEQPAHLAVRRGQLQLRRDGDTVAQFPCEDLGVVLVEHPATTYTHGALTALIDHGAALILCGADHLPQSVLLPIGEHSQIVTRLHLQIEAALPLKKQLWKQIVQAKIRAQAANLAADGPAHRLLRNLVSEVKSGDRTNVEAHAAKAYWREWLTNPDDADTPVGFRRLPDGAAPNALLNYGYTVMRAAVARAIVAAGLHPALGLHHSNRGNPYCLADDLMEPLRPIVDARVRELFFDDETEINPVTKRALLELLEVSVEAGGASGPLMVSLHRYVASLVSCLEGNRDRLEVPVLCASAATAACGSS